MNRRDIIILATVVNAVLLLVLFTTAQRPNKNLDFPVTSLPVKMMDINTPSSAHKNVENVSSASKTEVKKTITKTDRPVSTTTKENRSLGVQKSISQSEQPHALADQLKDMKDAAETSTPAVQEVVSIQPKNSSLTPAVVQPAVTVNNPSSAKEVNEDSHQYTTVVVKKGDFLERIAKANHTTVAVLMQINDLSSTQLKIGQVIKVPVSDKVEANPQVKVSNPNDYYIVKEGDSPWGIALRNGIRLNDLLQMNDLDEQKARKLRPGDRLRIR